MNEIKMATVYVVITDHYHALYTDFSVDAVFTERAAAEAYIAHHKDRRQSRIIEKPINPGELS